MKAIKWIVFLGLVCVGVPLLPLIIVVLAAAYLLTKLWEVVKWACPHPVTKTEDFGLDQYRSCRICRQVLDRTLQCEVCHEPAWLSTMKRGDSHAYCCASCHARGESREQYLDRKLAAQRTCSHERLSDWSDRFDRGLNPAWPEAGRSYRSCTACGALVEMKIECCICGDELLMRVLGCPEMEYDDLMKVLNHSPCPHVYRYAWSVSESTT